MDRGGTRDHRNGRKQYTLWDAYPHADLVTYPSLYEGFGNALLETIYFKRLAVVNRYPVYVADLAPWVLNLSSWRILWMKKRSGRCSELLHTPEQVRQMTEEELPDRPGTLFAGGFGEENPVPLANFLMRRRIWNCENKK